MHRHSWTSDRLQIVPVTVCVTEIFIHVSKSVLIQAGFEVLTAVKIFILWDIAPCNPLGINRHFGGTCPLHIQGEE
jgi:hypothetical protein